MCLLSLSSNRSFDADVLSAGFAGLLSAVQRQRQTAMLRLLTAFAAAPFLAACLRNLLIGGGQFQTSALGALVEAAYVMLFAVPLGLVLFGVAWKFGKIQWYWAAAAGAVVGLIFLVPATLPTLADERLRDWKKFEALTELGTVVLYCTGVALLPWVLGVWRNPAIWKKRRG